MTVIALTERAARRINEIMARSRPARCCGSASKAAAVRVSYEFDVDEPAKADDVVIEKDGATVLIDDVRSTTWAAR